ncbi:MAG: alanyl-tRNA synthetase [candidate division TA06 bacterium ADurb.Bin417]|uniref:Alanine--tRNA ligase n=1 Tax=candidate division TA06 bacterium ADurb.Bin417 TaxID=1852828 RepID=A0A1V5MKQ0_UNCT6|nr:MAG: alanyl-tRNA synthetase [candidate division TA06 bacterium ADurb.Bin417]
MLVAGGAASQVFLGVTPDLVEQGVRAGGLLKALAARFGGGAGGRDDFAQAGIKKMIQTEELVAALKAILAGGTG